MSGNTLKNVIVGIGGCGGNVVNSFVASKQINDHTISVDTDSLALKASAAVEKFLLTVNSSSPTCGLREDIELGIQTGLHFREKFLKRVVGYDTIIFCAGLGGGTGSGITTVFTKAATDMDMNVVCFLTLPFDFEGEERLRKARVILNQIKSYDAQVEVFHNQELFAQVPKGVSFSEAFEIVNKHCNCPGESEGQRGGTKYAG